MNRRRGARNAAKRHLCSGVLAAAVLGAPAPLSAGEWSGHLGGDVRWFAHDGSSSPQRHIYPSVVADLEYKHRGENGVGFLFAPFARIDRHDGERTHADVRELLWTGAGERYGWRAGIGKMFWGVTEFYHLADIINQTDLVEDSDGEEKLGQPMLNLYASHDWGMVNAFVLPGFRERTFPGADGRLRGVPPVDPDRASYESSRGRRHIDWALRWSYSGTGWDAGVYRFQGTSREPRFTAGVDAQGQPVLIPRYDLIEQTGLDLQANAGNWLWKLEAIRRGGGPEVFSAWTGGLEYTFVGVFGSRADIGLVAEAMRDARRERAPHFFQNDIGAGLRLTLNDAASTEALLGVIADRGHQTQLWTLEASRRLGDRWKLSVEGRLFRNVSPDDIVFGVSRDSYLQVGLERHL